MSKSLFSQCLFSVVLIFTALTSDASSVKPQSNKTDCHLIMGVSNWLPYQSYAKGRGAFGLQINLIEDIMEEANCLLTYKPMTFPIGLEALQMGEIDFMMNATVNESRKSFAYFSVPYRDEFLSLYSTDKYLERCQEMSLKELIRDGFKLSVQAGLVYGPELTEIQKDPVLNKKLSYSENNIQHVDLVESQQLDGVIDDPVVVAYRSTIYATGDKLSPCPIVISSSPVSLIFSKKTVSQEIVERVNNAIAKVKATKEYQKRWML
ncbi:amino acid ABC transporter substrate-binding protein [Aliikangiella marina]|uniref:Amino acid ABC transporter substrate-binding protein n=1 Tax=Aliikangiella marina TaxID=1712262 RepID=A0A545TJ37_9GAMM|nr:transporter substrate-binding domain-containing protein [Aliikangiella marina]TQV77249.1 amino acid ABC transporter substrate-binding protein [Aliikangiella marina]